MNFLYYAYVGICTLYNGVDFNKPIQLGATAPTTSAWDRRNTSTAVPNWFNDIYLNLHHSDPHDRPRFTKSRLTTDSFLPRAPCVDPPATPAPLDLTLGPEGHILSPNPIGISIFIHYTSFPPHLNPWLHIPAIPSTTIACTSSTPPVHPLHLHITNMMCPRMHQKLFGQDTSIPHTTHFYPSFELPGPLPHYVCIRFESHKHPTTNHSLFYLKTCRRPPRYVLYKGTYVPYDGTYSAPDQGRTLDV
jgi:hypothetical protein